MLCCAARERGLASCLRCLLDKRSRRLRFRTKETNGLPHFNHSPCTIQTRLRPPPPTPLRYHGLSAARPSIVAKVGDPLLEHLVFKAFSLMPLQLEKLESEGEVLSVRANGPGKRGCRGIQKVNGVTVLLLIVPTAPTVWRGRCCRLPAPSPGEG